MAQVTRWGIQISGSDPDAARAFEDFATRLLRLDQGMEAVLVAAGTHPDSVSLQISAAAFWLFGQTHAAIATGGTYLDRAELHLAGANEREAALFQAVRAWGRGAFLQSLEQMEAINLRWPEDLVTAKFAEFLYYVLGQQYHGPRYRAHLTAMAEHYPNDPDFLGMAAFAHELCDDLPEAQRLAERALECEVRNPWAHHALSHVLIRRGEVAEGGRRMREALPMLRDCAPVIYCHDAWHLGLFHLEELDFDSATQVLQEHVWSANRELVGVLLDSIALGWRIEMAGHSVSGFWNEMADYVEPRVTECVVPFLSAHWAYALARAQRGAALEQLQAAVSERAAQSDDEARRVWAPSGAPIVAACAKFGAGDAVGALELMEPAMPGMMQIGGSDAQDDLFRQTFYCSLARSKKRAQATTYLDRVLGNKKRSPLDNFFTELIR